MTVGGSRGARSIYAVVRRIPRGRVATYGQIAVLAGLRGQARLVGYALAALDVDTDVPWHRVVNARGAISLPATGHSARMQRARLEAEGVVFDGGCVVLKRWRWRPRLGGCESVPLVAFVLLMALACTRTDVPGGSGDRQPVRVGDTLRTYVLHVPPRPNRSPRPLLLAFHGTGESGGAMRRSTALDALGSRAGYLIAYLDAAVGNWAEGCDCSRADLEGVDDTGFVRAVVEDVARRYPVDRSRVYATGFSQGGLFVQRLACEMADLVAAVASVAAPMSSRLAETCAPSAPAGMLVIQGTLDDAYPYEGRRQGGRSLLGARETARFWRVLDGCAGDARARELPDRAADGTRIQEERWPACRGGVEVALYTVEGGRHAWSPSADAETETLLMEFFLRGRRAP